MCIIPSCAKKPRHFWHYQICSYMHRKGQVGMFLMWNESSFSVKMLKYSSCMPCLPCDLYPKYMCTQKVSFPIGAVCYSHKRWSCVPMHNVYIPYHTILRRKLVVIIQPHRFLLFLGAVYAGCPPELLWRSPFLALSTSLDERGFFVQWFVNLLSHH